MGAQYPQECTTLVSLLDLRSGDRRQIWSEPGGTYAGATAGWSPDGELLAIGYINPADDFASVVLDRDGSVIHRTDGYFPAPHAGNAWSADGSRLLLSGQGYGTPAFAELDPIDGSLTPLGLDSSRLRPVGRAGRHVLAGLSYDVTGPPAEGEPDRLFMVSMDDASEQPWLTVTDGVVALINVSTAGMDSALGAPVRNDQPENSSER